METVAGPTDRYNLLEDNTHHFTNSKMKGGAQLPRRQAPLPNVWIIVMEMYLSRVPGV